MKMYYTTRAKVRAAAKRLNLSPGSTDMGADAAPGRRWAIDFNVLAAEKAAAKKAEKEAENA